MFEYGGSKDQVSLHISDLSEIESSERYSILLRGLHEAGIAWFSGHKEKEPLVVSRAVQEEQPSLVKPMSLKPIGYFDNVVPKVLSNAFMNWPELGTIRYANGWAYDPDRPSQSVWVHFYGTTRELSSTYIGAVLANRSRPDVNRAKGISGLHGWRVQVPEAWDADGYRDIKGSCINNTHSPVIAFDCGVEFQAYAIDLTGDGHKRLVNSPYEITAIKYQRLAPK